MVFIKRFKTGSDLSISAENENIFSSDNLYVKFGATYVEENLPDMCWNLYDRSSRMYRRNFIKQFEGENKDENEKDEIYIFR